MQYSSQLDHGSSRQLALRVDGLPLCGGALDAYTLQAVIGSFSDEEAARLERLRSAAGPDVGVIDGHFDDVRLLFGQLGFQVRQIASEDLGITDLRIIAAGCPHLNTRLDSLDVNRFIERGGVLLSSDRAIRLPGISSYIGYRAGRPPGRARLELTGHAEASVSAPVWLDPGHLPLDPKSLDRSTSRLLATDQLTGDPLAVAVRAGHGAIIHSVPHWLQVPHPDALTSVERRPLRAVPQFRHSGNSYPGITLGGFLAQRAMLSLLLRSLVEHLNLDAPANRPGIERGK